MSETEVFIALLEKYGENQAEEIYKIVEKCIEKGQPGDLSRGCPYTAAASLTLGHELGGDYLQHPIQIFQILIIKALLYPLYNLHLIAAHEPGIAMVFLRKDQMIFPPVGLGVLPFQIALLYQTVHLIGGIGLGYVEKIRKLTHRGLGEHIDDLQGKGLHGRERALPLPHQLENTAVKPELELVVYFHKTFIYHFLLSSSLYNTQIF